MDLLKKIKTILEKNKHHVEIEDTGTDEILIFHIDDEYLIKILIANGKKLPFGFQDYNYLVDYCWVENFDRWANSGWREGYDNIDDLLTTFRDDSLWMSLVFFDSISDIIEECKYENNMSKLEVFKEKLLNCIK